MKAEENNKENSGGEFSAFEAVLSVLLFICVVGGLFRR
jgi:hypothetical protein